jgi:nucleotidyltransferase substrate binding protein (TIGR01987 family)
MVVEDKIKLQVEQLKKAVATLREAVGLAATRINKDATIQRFEYCFELAWKCMQSAVRIKGVEMYNPRDSIRAAAQAGFVANPEVWIGFLKARNLAAHTYEESTADEVYEAARQSLPELEALIQALSQPIL